MIEIRQRTAYYSQAANKHFFTKKGASDAEAAKLIEAKYPTEPYEPDTGAGWFWKQEENLCRLHKRLSRRIRRTIGKAGSKP